MRNRELAIGTLGALAIAHAAGAATPLNLNTGYWELVRTTEESASTQISSERFETLTDAQRKELEATFPERVPGRRNVQKSCITEKHLAAGFLPEANPACHRTKLEETETSYAVRMECLDTLGSRSTELHLTAAQPDRVSGHLEGAIKGPSGKVGRFRIAIEGRWLQEECPPAIAGDAPAAAESP